MLYNIIRYCITVMRLTASTVLYNLSRLSNIHTDSFSVLQIDGAAITQLLLSSTAWLNGKRYIGP